MKRPDRVHDRALLDALDDIDPIPFDGPVWRVTREGRNPLLGSGAGGRWSPPGEFEALYTSLDPEGALAEIGYRLSLEPVWPSRVRHQIHMIQLLLERTLQLADLSQLSPLGVEVARYRSFDYAQTRAIASAAHFLEFDGLLIPSARCDSSNLVVFPDRLGPNTKIEAVETKSVNWSGWRKAQT
jgi:RES domain-containing protein